MQVPFTHKFKIVGSLLTFLLLGLMSGQTPPAAPRFHWLDPVKNGDTLAAITQTFENELKPDDPEKVAPYEPAVEKRILRVGVYSGIALVLIEEKSAEDLATYVEPYSFDLELKRMSKIEMNSGVWMWSFYGYARFEAGAPSDVLFTYYSCWDCEATRLVGAFRYDSRDRVWKLRLWNEKEQIYIGGSHQYTDDGVEVPSCIFRIGRFEGNHLDQAVVFCRETTWGEDEKKPLSVENLYWVYDVRNGQSAERELKKTDEKTAALQFICAANKSSRLCAGKTASPAPAH